MDTARSPVCIGAEAEEKLWELLDTEIYELSTVVMHLAWRCGLQRHEIWDLKWSEIDFERAFFRLSDREIPVEQKTIRQLGIWEKVCKRYGNEYVAYSLSRRQHVVEQTLNVVARKAIEGGRTEEYQSQRDAKGFYRQGVEAARLVLCDENKRTKRLYIQNNVY